MKLGVLAFSAVLIGVTPVQAQDETSQSLDEALENLSQDAAEAYLGSLPSAFGANMNAGWLGQAATAQFLDLHVEVGLIAMGSFFASDDDVFETTTTFNFTRRQAEQILADENIPSAYQDDVIDQMIEKTYTVSMSGPTAVGSKDEHVQVVFPGDTFTVSDGGQTQTYQLDAETVEVTQVTGVLDELPVLPLAVPQFGIGTVYGTKLLFRFVPGINLTEEIGDVGLFGFGIQHNPAVWLPAPLPVDVALGFYTQKLEAGDIVEVTAMAYGINASKPMGIFTPYAGFLLESSSIDISYTYQLESQAGTEDVDINFEIDGENKYRFTLGGMLHVGFFSLNADFNIGNINSISSGLNFNF